MPDKSSLVAQIVSSYATRPDATIESIVALTTRLTDEIMGEPAAAAAPHFPTFGAITPETAVNRDKIYCLCCGKGFKMLKRHLGAEHGLSEPAYRNMFKLADDYPLVAPSYSERKANYAKSVGFGKYERAAVKAEA